MMSDFKGVGGEGRQKLAKKVGHHLCMFPFRKDVIKPWKIIVRLSPDEILSKCSNVYWTSLLGLILHIHTQVELPTSTF